jgi:anti-repressor protein
MTNDLTPFTNGEFELEIRMHEVDGFRVQAPGLARALGFASGKDLLRSIPDGEKGWETAPTLGGEQRVGYVTEAGFYRALGQRQAARVADASIRAAVERFQSWVYGDVLPSLRKTGRFEVSQRFEIPASFAEALELAAKQAREMEHAQAQLTEQAPLVAAEEHHRSAHGLKAVGDFANDLKAWAKTHHPSVKVKHQAVWDHLARLDMVIRGNTVRHNQPTAKAVEQGWCVPKVSDYDTSEGSRSSTTTRLTPKGEGYAWDRITSYVEANGTLELPRRIGEAS